LFKTGSLNVTPNTTVQNLIVGLPTLHIGKSLDGKSEAEVTNNNAVLDLTTDRHEASRDLSATA